MKTMQTTRPEFLKVAAATGVGAVLPWRRAYASAQSPSLRKFIQMLPGFGSGIPVATSVPYLGADYFQLTAGEYTQQLHPQLPPSRLWGYADATTGVHRHLGPVIVAQRGTPVRLTLTNRPLDPAPLVPPGVTTLPPGIRVRDLTLNEDFDQFGRLIQRLGTTQRMYEGTFARNYEDAPTEMPMAGAVEAWRISNLSGDTHPIHFHLVNVQVVSRQAFDGRRLRFHGQARPPDANERGWKETVRMNPGECTTVIMKFDLAPAPFPVPASPRTGGHEYV